MAVAEKTQYKRSLEFLNGNYRVCRFADKCEGSKNLDIFNSYCINDGWGCDERAEELTKRLGLNSD